MCEQLGQCHSIAIMAWSVSQLFLIPC